MGTLEKVGVVSFGSSVWTKQLFHGVDEVIKWSDAVDVMDRAGDGMVLRLTVEMEQFIRRYMRLQNLVFINWIHNGHTALVSRRRNSRK